MFDTFRHHMKHGVVVDSSSATFGALYSLHFLVYSCKAPHIAIAVLRVYAIFGIGFRSEPLLDQVSPISSWPIRVYNLCAVVFV